MELSYPLVRVPFERANKSFRLYHKQLTRELAQAVTQIKALDNGNNQQPDHQIDIDAAVKKLTELAKTLQSLKQSATSNVLEQQNDLENCAKRTRYLKIQQDTKIGGDSSMFICQTDEGSINDRLIADYLLGQGYLKSAKIMEDNKNIGYLLDYDLHAECQAVLTDLRDFHTEKAIAWCSQNGTRLRRLQSLLEFHLRLQDFVEYIRSRKPLEAVQYARTYLAPLAIQPDNQDLRDAAIGEIQIAMATLAFESPEKCSIEAYERVFAVDRWLMLEKMFRKTFNDTVPEWISKQKATPKKEEGDNGDGNEDSGNENGKDQLKPSTALQPKSNDSASCSQEASGSKKRKHARTETPVPICPACTEVGSQLCTGLPFAYHPHSRLVCRVMGCVMDEHNPPFVLPNGRVYSKQGIELLTQRSSDGMIKCVDTHDIFSPSDVKPIYIL
ncbi:unnamed protein product [Peronospora farinosa]|uniref:Macrophage erythroblast attacher n=1 Tax=Peronospora farinosa TaxID=134698 RepID=A0ABN8CD87_9STRA|nr:unnamed protein product [Peronospora farinosa]